jgi:galactokinase
VLRAIHFFAEHNRVLKQVECLKEGRFNEFLENVSESGRSSFMYLQNVYAQETELATSLALAMTDCFLKGRGAFRVHGGGFAGIILAFVPDELLGGYTALLEPVFGKGSVRRMKIREAGAVKLA